MLSHKRSTKLCACVVIGALLAGCAGAPRGMGAGYRPMIDNRNVDMNRYESDLRDCQAYATQTAGAGETAVAGAAAGAVLGAVLAAAAGSGYSRNRSARVGAVSGAIGGAAAGENDQRNIIRRCMSGRGYSVLQ